MTSINPSIPPCHGQYSAPESPNEQNKSVERGCRQCKQTVGCAKLTLKPFVGHSELTCFRQRVGWGGGWGGGVRAQTCEAQHKWMCVCVHILVGSDGKQQSGRVAMRTPGNWMTRSTFLPGKKKICCERGLFLSELLAVSKESGFHFTTRALCMQREVICFLFC